MNITEVIVTIEQVEWVLYEDMLTVEERRSQLHELAWKLVNATRQMSDWKVRPRSEVEELVTTFVVENKMSAYYGKDTEGVFVVKFMVGEEPDE